MKPNKNINHTMMMISVRIKLTRLDMPCTGADMFEEIEDEK